MTQMQYEEFLATKAIVASSVGVHVDPDNPLHPALFPFQRACARWAVRKGRCALFEPPGAGKTPQELVWSLYSGNRVLNLAPLGVAHQTVREGAKFGIEVTYARSMAESPSEGITITNYEMIDHFDPDAFDAVVCDESSILKAVDGKTRQKLIDMFRDTPRKLCGTATPAPNDISEMANHAEFLGVMTREEMLATFFVHDDAGWRLKGYARDAFYRWLATWAMSMNKPSDLGFEDTGYELPPLTVTPVVVKADYRPVDQLFAVGLKGITERSQVRKQTVGDRVAASVNLIRADQQQWIAWCGRNDEQDRVAAALGDDCVSIDGRTPNDEKLRLYDIWQSGQRRTLVSKVSVFGFGMNMQNCARQVFVGLSDSWESYYQAIRRSWRFAQTNPVHVYVVISEPEQVIYENILRKEREACAMSEELIRHVALYEQEEIHGSRRLAYAPSQPMEVPSWLRSA